VDAQTVQIHCPHCNAVQPKSDLGDYECEFCLQPFSTVQAESEQERLLNDIQGWLKDKVGASALGGQAVDEASRAYIFQEKILPDLRREVDRSLEMLGGYNQFPLVQPPIVVDSGSEGMANPLVSSRDAILDLKGLRARLSHPQVIEFALGERDKGEIQEMDRRIADFMHLSNVAGAASQLSVAGYLSARRNLEVVIEEIDESISAVGTTDTGLAGYLATVKNRYQGLTEYCRLCEELCSPNNISGASVAERLESLASQMEEVAVGVESVDYDPATTMPLVVGINREVTAIRLLARWALAYDALATALQLPFVGFYREVVAFQGDRQLNSAEQAELLEGYIQLVQAVRGEIAVSVVSDFRWVDTWVEKCRARKTLGLFGVNETVSNVVQFLLPAIWLRQ